MVDLISAHAYFHEEDGDLASFLACPVRLDEFIDGIVSTIDHVKATLRKSKQINISFDEWNVWYEQSEPTRAVAQGWPVGPPVRAALQRRRRRCRRRLLIALMRHSDRVVSANLAQLVNVIAPIMTEANGEAWRQTTYYPFAQAATTAAGTVLLSKLVAPVVGTAKWGEVPVVDAVATHDPDQGEMALFIVNRSVDQDVQLTVRTPGVRPTRIASATVLCDDDPHRIARVDASLSPRDNQLVESDEAGLRIAQSRHQRRSANSARRNVLGCNAQPNQCARRPASANSDDRARVGPARRRLSWACGLASPGHLQVSR